MNPGVAIEQGQSTGNVVHFTAWIEAFQRSYTFGISQMALAVSTVSDVMEEISVKALLLAEMGIELPPGQVVSL